MTTTMTHIVFTGPPGPDPGKFVEVETPEGKSISVGEWHEREDGYWELRLPTPREQDQKTVFVAWTNSDLTEGRGASIPLAVCELEATAIRLGRGKSVQGTNCTVREAPAFWHAGCAQWLGPVCIVQATREDRAADQVRQEARQLAIRKTEALDRARALGMSDEDIKLLAKD